MNSHESNHQTQYHTLKTAAGFVELDRRTLVAITGPDRKSFLNSFCTADIKTLADGQVTEAFVLNEKGKTLSHLWVAALPDQLLLFTSGGQAPSLISHLDKYIIREDVQLTDCSDTGGTIWIGGDQASVKLDNLVSPLPERNTIVQRMLEDRYFSIAHLEIARWGFWVRFEIADAETLIRALTQAGLKPCTVAALETVRIEYGTPRFGVDIDVQNLPQEVQRDAKAISFRKGCYLGQETVARIDAIGHVNQWLVKIEFSSDTDPVPGMELTSDGAVVGRVTSIAKIPAGRWVGLAYVKRGKAKPGTALESATGSVYIKP